MNWFDELDQYDNDRPGWIALVAPRQAMRMLDDTYDDDVLAAVWAGMKRDYQTAVWNILPVEARARIKAVRAKV